MNKINVGNPTLPDWEEFHNLQREIKKSNFWTNFGPIHSRLTRKIEEYYNINNVILTCNGTLPLLLAMHKMEYGDEVITTPFSYVATTSSILFLKLKPVFVDIEEDSFCMDHSKIVEKITEKTRAILITHVFGNVGNIEAYMKIAQDYGLELIFDAAHSFDTYYRGKSIFGYGDLVATSFHATKIFHTAEGGMLVVNSANYHDYLEISKIGHSGAYTYNSLPGINMKMSELNASLGLAVFENAIKSIDIRRRNYDLLKEGIANADTIKINPFLQWNYAYAPFLFTSESVVNSIIAALSSVGIEARRYFYPSLNTIFADYNTNDTPVSKDISRRILVLPNHENVTKEICYMIIKIINNLA